MNSLSSSIGTDSWFWTFWLHRKFPNRITSTQGENKRGDLIFLLQFLNVYIRLTILCQVWKKCGWYIIFKWIMLITLVWIVNGFKEDWLFLWSGLLVRCVKCFKVMMKLWCTKVLWLVPHTHNFYSLLERETVYFTDY